MSSELRLKKLRGSGGYVVARLSDQEQSKGNLGGPDLFLAPVGRIDAERISKHFCGTCEKEFEGSPKIDYESPNEEVAENLILAEKGKYACQACNSTIAEYRNFRKPDGGKDVGLAKPIRAEGGGGTRPPEPAAPPPPPPPADPQQAPAREPQPQPAPAREPAGSAVNAIEGMTVFDENAKKMGVAKKVGVDSTQTVVLAVTRDDGAEISVPWSRVKMVGEVVLLGGADAPQPPASEPGRCPKCGFSNKADAKFCEECGSKLAT